MKAYLKDEISMDEVINELKKIDNVSVLDCKTFFMIKYKTSEDLDSEALRINLNDRRVVLSATSKILREKLKGKLKFSYTT